GGSGPPAVAPRCVSGLPRSAPRCRRRSRPGPRSSCCPTAAGLAPGGDPPQTPPPGTGRGGGPPRPPPGRDGPGGGGGPSRAPIPSLLLTGAVHHHLIRERTRTRAGLVVECGDAREAHHIALLIGYGAAAVNPYLALESVQDMVRRGELENLSAAKAAATP